MSKKTFSEARKMYDGGRAAKRGWNCGDCGAEKNRSDQCRSCGSPKRYHRDHPSNAHLREDLASGRPIKKPVSSNLLKQRAKDNEKALKSGFMKMPDYARKKFDEAKDKDWPRPFSKPERDKFLQTAVDATLSAVAKEKKKKKTVKESAPAVGDVDKKTMGQVNRRIDKDMKKKGIKTNWMKGVKEENINELVSGFRKGDEEISKKGTLHKSKHITPDTDASKVADALSKHDRLKTIKKAHKKLQKEGVIGDVKKKIGKEVKKFQASDTAKQIRKKKTTYGVKTEAKKPVVHFKGEDKLKTVKIKYNKPIKTKVTDIGPGGKEVVRKDWSEEQIRIVESLKNLLDRGIEDKRKERTVQVGQKRAKDGKSLEPVMGKTKAPKHLLVRYGKPEKKR